LISGLVWMLWLSVATAAEPEARVGTLNVRGLPWPLAQRRAVRLAEVSRWLKDGGFAVVGLQEVWRGARSLLASDRVHFPEGRKDSGIAVYTPHPLVEPLTLVPFAAQRGVDALKAKGLVRGVIEVPQLGRLTLGIVHLQAGSGPRNAEVRGQQLDEALAALGPGACLLMGDFNVYGSEALDDASLARLADAGFVEVVQVEPHRGTSVYGKARFDRLFVREGPVTRFVSTRARVLRHVSASDHYPVTARLRRRAPR